MGRGQKAHVVESLACVAGVALILGLGLVCFFAIVYYSVVPLRGGLCGAQRDYDGVVVVKKPFVFFLKNWLFSKRLLFYTFPFSHIHHLLITTRSHQSSINLHFIISVCSWFHIRRSFIHSPPESRSRGPRASATQCAFFSRFSLMFANLKSFQPIWPIKCVGPISGSRYVQLGSLSWPVATFRNVLHFYFSKKAS